MIRDDIIVTHSIADFDALASLVASTFLYPDSIGLIPRQVQPAPKKFLGLHREIFHLLPAKDFIFKDINRLIIVDTSNWQRLEDGSIIRQMDIPNITLWDHHMKGRDIDATELHYEEIGATTSLLVREIMNKDIAFTPMHATLFLLGIYDDTGNLSYSNTKTDDAKATAFLIENGADLNIVNSFINDSFDSNQQKLLSMLLETAETMDFKGVNITISQINLDSNISQLSQVVGKYRELSGVDVVFGIFSYFDKSFIIARSSIPSFDVASIIRQLGGGGHPGAASAVINTNNPDLLYDDVKKLILDYDMKIKTIRDILFMPTESIAPNRKISEIKEYLNKNHINCFIITNGDEIVGVLSNNDIYRAIQKGRGNNPVKTLIQKNQPTLSPDISLRDAANLMMEKDYSLLSVFENNEFLGIIRRNDLMLHLYDL